ncbi:MAG: rhomboid family intramembrane serine protease [Phycisphaerae bacterium]|nr:rhomboid family intramembrane serine protease [Gemmatimonadaceae bacterium]
MAHAVFDETEFSRPNHAVHWIIGLCVAVFFVQETVVNQQLVQCALGYATGDLGRRQLWKVFTYMFVHGDFLHLALNMITFWIFGPRVERAWGSSSFTWFFLWCGLGGWLFHYIFGGQGVLMGASAAILGVAVAYASRWPDEEVLLFMMVPMKVKWFVGFMIALNLVMMYLRRDAEGGTAWAAHMGGIAAGFVYMRLPNAQSLDRFRRRIAPAPEYGDEPPRAVPKTSSRPRERDVDDIVAQSKAAVARVRPATPVAAPQIAAPAVTASAVDVVLDKIAAHGLESLTAAERLVLEEMSRKLRNR